jgi:hypothetical protein
LHLPAPPGPKSGAEPDTLKVLSWNVRQGPHLDAACETITERDPDVVFWQEMRPGDLDKVVDVLDMDAYPAAFPLAARFVTEGMRPGAPRNSPVIFLRRGGSFVVEDHFDHGWSPWQPPAHITVRMRSPEDADVHSPRLLNLVSSHLCYFSGEVRMAETAWLSTLAKPGMLTIVGMDRNGYLDGFGPDWGILKETPGFDHAHWHNRTYRDELDGERLSDDRTDQSMAELQFGNPVDYPSGERSAAGEPQPTAGWGRPSQGGQQTIDAIYGTKRLMHLTAHAQVLDEPRLRRISDHLPTEWSMHKPGLWAQMNQKQFNHR